MSNSNWSHEELEASVETYIEMRQKSIDGIKFIKKSYYEELASKFGRTIKSYEYRMQNISHVYSLMGREWIPGLRPAKNVGARVASEIESIINQIEGQTLSKVVAFETDVSSFLNKKNLDLPSGNIKPSQGKITVSKYNRDPKVVAWILKEVNGNCECCNQNAPFFKDDNEPFLEVHHLRRLADNGSDTITNAVALCPNCHRELHYGKNKSELVDRIYSNISRLRKE